jgi:hypothetical protein
MPAPFKDSRGCGFVVTELGRSAAASVETCDCRYAVRDGMLVCDFCGNAAGQLRPARDILAGYAPKRD